MRHHPRKNRFSCSLRILRANDQMTQIDNNLYLNWKLEYQKNTHLPILLYLRMLEREISCTMSMLYGCTYNRVLILSSQSPKRQIAPSP